MSFTTDEAVVAELAAEVNRLATESPDYVHMKECVYVENGKGCCIVGQAAMNLGLIDASFEQSIGNEGVGVPSFLGDYLNLSVKLGSKHVVYLEIMQERQDDQHPWGEADEEASEVYE